MTVEDGFDNLLRCEPLSITKAASTPAKIVGDGRSDSLLKNLWKVDETEEACFKTFQPYNCVAQSSFPVSPQFPAERE